MMVCVECLPPDTPRDCGVGLTRLGSYQAVSFIQSVRITLVLQLIKNDSFRLDSSIAGSEFFRASWVNRW